MELSFETHGDGCRPNNLCTMCRLRSCVEARVRVYDSVGNFRTFENEVGLSTFSPDTHWKGCQPNDPCGNCKGWKFLSGTLHIAPETLNAIFHPQPAPREQDEGVRVRAIRLDTLELSVRAKNALRNDGREVIGDVLTLTEVELMRVPDFGRKSLVELKAALYEIGMLYPGMDAKK